METGIAIFAGVCVVSLALCVFLVARATSAVILASARQTKVFQDTLMKHDDFMINAMTANIQAAADITQEENIRRQLARSGITPYLGEPGSRIREEIAAIASQMNIPVDAAARYLRSEIMGEEVNGGPSRE